MARIAGRAPVSRDVRRSERHGDARPGSIERWWSQRCVKLVAVSALVLGLLVVGVASYGWWRLSSVERVDLKGALTEPERGEPVTYLLVGVDSRAGIDPDDPDASAFIGEPVEGSRADAILLLQEHEGWACLVSVPRDLWYEDGRTGDVGRLGLAYEDGRPAFVGLVTESLEVPIHHYIEVDFGAVRSLVDSLGGVEIEFDHPSRDLQTGLDIADAGTVELDGRQALAFARSRHFEELTDEGWTEDPSGDLGRTARQREILGALLADLEGEWAPWVHDRALGGASDGLLVDEALGNLALYRFATRLRSTELRTTQLPVDEGEEISGRPVYHQTDSTAGVLGGSCGGPPEDR